MFKAARQAHGLFAATVVLLGTVGVPVRSNPASALVAHLDSAFTAAFAHRLSPALAIGIVSGDSVLYARGFGYADVENRLPVSEHTRFYIASTSKALTALAAMNLVHRGMLDMDAPLSRYLPQVMLQAPLSADSITLRELLAHTHGINQVGPVSFRTAFTGEFDSKTLPKLLERHNAKGARGEFRYSNLSYDIVGMILEAVTGESWKTVVDREVIRPLGMERTTAVLSSVDPRELAKSYRADADGYTPVYFAKADGNMGAAGGHVTTVLDMTRLLIAELNAGKVDGKQVIPADVIASSQKVIASQDKQFWSYHRFGWAPGWDAADFEGDTVYTRFGGFGSFFSYLAFSPKHRVGIVAYVNEEYVGTELVKLTTTYALSKLSGHPQADSLFLAGLRQMPEKRSATLDKLAAEAEKRRLSADIPPPFPLSAYAGTYVSEDLGTMVWSVEGDRLKLTMGIARSTATIEDASANAWRVEIVGAGTPAAFQFTGDKATSVEFLGYKFDRVK